MADINISKYTTQVLRVGSTPSSPGFSVSEGQDPVDPSGNPQTHLPVTIATAATGLSITESQVLGGAGTVGQYIRGDGSLADFPESSGGGSSVSYYLNGSVAQGTIGGVAYKELNKVPILGAGTDFTINANGYIASFITDAGDPNLLEIPGGNWNFETYFSANNGGGSPTFYVELYKYNGTTFTLLASNSAIPEFIAFGTNITAYFTTLAVPTTTLALTDRLAVRYYVTHSGRTITMHTEGPHLCQIITTFTTGITALNGLTAQVQNFAVGTSGTDFAIASATATHTFNLPTASATNRGALSSADWTTFNNKTSNLGTVTSVGLSSATSGVTIGSTPVTTSGTITLAIATASGSQNGLLSSTDWTTFNGKVSSQWITNGSDIYYNIGNVGIGNSNPALSDGSSATLQIKNTVILQNVIGIQALFSNNAHFDGSSWKRFSASGAVAAMRINGDSGQNGISFHVAPPGAAGSAISDWDTTDIKMRINENGRVGIGTMTPSVILEVVGDAKISNSVTANSFIKSAGTSAQFLKADGSVDSTTYVSTVTASSPLFSSGGTTPNITIQQASGSQNGFLSSTDWTTFNGKQNALTNPVTGTGASGQVAYFTGTSAITSESNLFWDATNDRLGIGTDIPLYKFHVNTGTDQNFGVRAGTDVSAQNGVALTSSTNNNLFLRQLTLRASDVVMLTSSSVLIGSATALGDAPLQVNGTGTTYATFNSTSSIGAAISWQRSGVSVGAIGNSGVMGVGILDDLEVRSGIGKGLHLKTDGGQLTLATGGASTFSSSVSVGGYLTGQGTNPGGLGGSRYVLDWLSGQMRIFSYGADTSTNGGFLFNSQRSNGTNSQNFLSIASTGEATFSSNVYMNNNVGIGTTSPVSNDGSSRTLQLGNRLVIQNVIGTQFLLGTNCYYDGGSWKYIAAAKAQAVRGTGESGTIQFSISPTGTAGGTITNMDGSDVKMVIHNNGNVLIGTVTNGASKLRIVGLPTSAAGLSSGDVYNLSGVLMIA